MNKFNTTMALAIAAALGISPAMAATYNYKNGVLNGTAEGPVYSPERFSVQEVKLDFAAIAAARIAAGSAAIANTDILQVVNVKAGCWVPAVGLQVSTVEGAALTVSVGGVMSGSWLMPRPK